MQAGNDYEKNLLDGVSLVFAATSDVNLNRTVAADALGLGIWCNMATDPELGSFIVPSIVERGPLSIAVSTSGLSPAIAKLLRHKFEQEIGTEWEVFIRLLGELRSFFQKRRIAEKQSHSIFSALASLPFPEWIREGSREKALSEISEICRPIMTQTELQAVWENAWKQFS